MFDLDGLTCQARLHESRKAKDNRTTLAMNWEMRGKGGLTFCMYDVSAAQPYELFAEFWCPTRCSPVTYPRLLLHADC